MRYSAWECTYLLHTEHSRLSLQIFNVYLSRYIRLQVRVYKASRSESLYSSETQSLQGVHTRSCVRSLCIHVEGRRWRGSTRSCRALVAWRGGLFLTEAEIEVLSCVFPFWTRVRVYVNVCVCIRTHTHTLHMGCSMWAQGSGQDTWRARRIQIDWISANMYSYLCIIQSTHVYIYAVRRD